MTRRTQLWLAWTGLAIVLTGAAVCTVGLVRRDLSWALTGLMWSTLGTEILVRAAVARER